MTQETVSVTMHAGEMATLLKSALTSCSTETTRPLLAGVLIELSPGIIKTVSTDSYTLLIQEFGGYVEVVGEGSFILDGRDIKEWVKMLTPSKSTPTTLSVLGRGVTLTIMGATFTTSVVEGKFPSYEMLIPAMVSYAHERSGFKATQLARMGAVLIPGYDKARMTKVVWVCENMLRHKASLWSCKGEGYVGTFLQMPCKFEDA